MLYRSRAFAVRREILWCSCLARQIRPSTHFSARSAVFRNNLMRLGNNRRAGEEISGMYDHSSTSLCTLPGMHSPGAMHWENDSLWLESFLCPMISHTLVGRVAMYQCNSDTIPSHSEKWATLCLCHEAQPICSSASRRGFFLFLSLPCNTSHSVASFTTSSRFEKSSLERRRRCWRPR